MKPAALDVWRLGAGAVCGLVLVSLLVPALSALNGASGPMGPSLPLLFLMPVLVAAVLGGRLSGAVVAFAAIATWDWFFIPPLHRVTIYNARDILALIVFLAVAVITGHLATNLRSQAREALRRAASAEALYDLSRALIARHEVATVLEALTGRLSEAFGLEGCAVLLPGDSRGAWHTTAARGTLPETWRVESNRTVQAMVTWATTHGEPAGLTEGGVRFLPLRIGERAVGVLQMVHGPRGDPGRDGERLIATFANGAAIALEQARLAEEERAAILARERDAFKTTLLSSVSHDLRTPLAGIKAAASSLLQTDVRWSEEDRRSFAADINVEADRLARFVSNLLDLSRIELGAIAPDRDWDRIDDLIERVLRRIDPVGHPVRLTIPADLPPIFIDSVQIEQVVANLLENAVKYSPGGVPIEIGARFEGETLLFWVADRGPGIARQSRERIFETFYRGGGQTQGTGMGLAIVKGLVTAHGGRVWVEGGPEGGSVFYVALPSGPVPAGPR